MICYVHCLILSKFEERETTRNIKSELTLNTCYNGRTLTPEVVQHLGDNIVRCIALEEAEGFKRNCPVVSTNRQISAPVGEEVIGRILNVTGDAIGFSIVNQPFWGYTCGNLHTIVHLPNQNMPGGKARQNTSDQDHFYMRPSHQWSLQ